MFEYPKSSKCFINADVIFSTKLCSSLFLTFAGKQLLIFRILYFISFETDNVNNLVDGDGDIKTLGASNFKIFRVPIDSKEDQSQYQFKKIPVVDFKKLKNQSKGSLGLLLRSLHTRLKNDVPKMLPEPGHVFHEKRKRFTIMTSTNAGFLDFTENWLLSLKRIGLNHSISIIAEDAVAYRYLTTKYDGGNIQIYATSSNYSSIKAFQFRSAEYKSLVNRRAEYMLHFLNKGIDVLAVDVDAYWFRDPMEVIRGGFDVYDVWVSLGADVKKTPCPCCMYLKSKPNVIQMVKAWSERMQRLEGKENDQEALGQIMWKFKVLPLHHGMRVNAARLDNDLFPTGQVLFKPSWWWEHGKRVYVVHANRIGNHDKKVAFFREYGLWIIEPYNVDLT